MTDFTINDDLRIITLAKADVKADMPPLTAEPSEVKTPAPRPDNLNFENKNENSSSPMQEEVPSTCEHNMLIISDTDLTADLKLTGFNKIIQWKPELFLNRKLSDIIVRTPFIWMNLRRPGCREYISRSVSGSSYNLLIAYSGSRNDSWVQQLAGANPDAVLIKTTKLKQFDSLSSEEILEQLMAKMVDVSRPDSKARKVLKFLFGCFLKKQ